MVKFTKASRNDGDLVTVRVSQLNKFKRVRSFDKGDRIILIHSNNVESIWTVNRDGETLASRNLPRRFLSPTVGNPVFINVKDIRKVR